MIIWVTRATLEAAARWAGDPGALTDALAGAGGDLSAADCRQMSLTDVLLQDAG